MVKNSLIAGLAAAGLALPALAAEDPIAVRQALMSGNGAAGAVAGLNRLGARDGGQFRRNGGIRTLGASPATVGRAAGSFVSGAGSGVASRIPGRAAAPRTAASPTAAPSSRKVAMAASKAAGCSHMGE